MLTRRVSFCRKRNAELRRLGESLRDAAEADWGYAPHDKQRTLGSLQMSLHRLRQLLWPATEACIPHRADERCKGIWPLAREFVRQHERLTRDAWLRVMAQYLSMRESDSPDQTHFAPQRTVDLVFSRIFLELAVLCEVHTEIARNGLVEAIGTASSKLHDLMLIDFDALAAGALSFEDILSSDPSGFYRLCDVRTKNCYRLAVARIATNLSRGEREVAWCAATLCRSAHNGTSGSHIGYYLVGDGVSSLFAALDTRRAPLLHFGGKISVGTYRALVTVVALIMLLAFGAGSLHASQGVLYAFAVMFLAYEAATTCVQETLMLASPRRHCASLNVEHIAVAERRVAIAVPTLLISPAQVREVLSRLEQNFTTARDPTLSMVVLADFEDSADEMPCARELALRAEFAEGIADLNRRHCPHEPRFLLLDRARRFSTIENVWMGWERKLGKVEALFRLILGQPSELRACQGPSDALRGVRYVLVLDDDNSLTPGALQGMIGAMAHPLNRPRVDDRGVAAGHAMGIPHIRQRCATSRLPDFSWRSFDFDFFGQVPFPGKGIYDVEAFMAATANRIPEGCVLSHDTAEGFWARPALITQAVVLEEFPSSYLKLTERQHRWMRGNWQNLLLMQIGRFRRPGALARLFVDRQNRATLLPIAKVAALVAAMAAPVQNLLAVAMVAALCVVPTVFPKAVLHALTRSCGLRSRLREIFLFNLVQFVMAPHRALVSLDAIVRSTWRMLQRRRLLQWQSAASLELSRSRLSMSTAYLILSVILGVLFATYLCTVLGRQTFALLVVGFWVAAPPMLTAVRRDPTPAAAVVPTSSTAR